MEKWEPIVGYEGLYEVSNLGRVRNARNGKIKAINDNGRGYKKVNLWKDNIGKTLYVHRLVAQAFIPNPANLPQVNHIDENKENNSVDNLEWCDNSYNNTYGTKRERQAETFLNNGKTCYKIKKLDLNGNYICSYRSMREAERENGLCNGCISQYFLNNYSQCGGFKWERI